MNAGSASLTEVTMQIMVSHTSLTLYAMLCGSVYRRAAATLRAMYYLFGHTRCTLLTVSVVIIWELYLRQGLVSVNPHRGFGAVPFLENRVVLIFDHIVAHLQGGLHFRNMF
jgi:hypothetical protein